MPALWLACCLRELDPNRHTGPGYAAFCGGIGRAAAPRCDAGAKVVERQFRADLGRIDWTPLDAGLPVDDLAAVAGDLAAAGRDREPAA